MASPWMAGATSTSPAPASTASWSTRRGRAGTRRRRPRSRAATPGYGVHSRSHSSSSAAESCQAPAFAGAFGLALRGWMVTIFRASRRSGRRLPCLVVYGKRASLTRLVLLVQRLLGWNLAAVLIHVMDIEQSIRMQEERTRSADAGELVHMFDGRIRKPARMQVHGGVALHPHAARAAHHHQLFVGRMKVPGRATAFRALHQQDRRPVRWVTPFHR